MRGAYQRELHGHRVVQDPEEDPHSDPQALQDLQNPQLLHAKSEIYPE